MKKKPTPPEHVYPPPFGKEEDCICPDSWRSTMPANHCEACEQHFERKRRERRGSMTTMQQLTAQQARERLRALEDPDFAWTPQHLGNGVYCSPACGGLCTYTAYTRAIHASAALAKKLGLGWKPKVWENLGWHWRVEKGGCMVWLERDGKYRILMNPEIFNMPDRKGYRSARVAVRDQIRYCRSVITKLSEAIQELTA